MSVRLDLSLTNVILYRDCQIETVAGRQNLTTPIPDAVNLVGRNVNEWVQTIPTDARTDITLTGPMAVWAYLIVFHAVVHAFGRVYYDDGRNGPVLIAAHG